MRDIVRAWMSAASLYSEIPLIPRKQICDVLPCIRLLPPFCGDDHVPDAKMYERDAEKGHPIALNNLGNKTYAPPTPCPHIGDTGVMYCHGIHGCPVDLKRALECFKRANTEVSRVNSVVCEWFGSFSSLQGNAHDSLSNKLNEVTTFRTMDIVHV